MATPVSELDGFMSKFKSLWKCGLDADLLLRSISGQVTVTFSFVLSGNLRPFPGHSSPPLLVTNVRGRRCIRRLNAMKSFDGSYHPGGLIKGKV